MRYTRTEVGGRSDGAGGSAAWLGWLDPCPSRGRGQSGIGVVQAVPRRCWESRPYAQDSKLDEQGWGEGFSSHPSGWTWQQRATREKSASWLDAGTPRGGGAAGVSPPTWAGPSPAPWGPSFQAQPPGSPVFSILVTSRTQRSSGTLGSALHNTQRASGVKPPVILHCLE